MGCCSSKQKKETDSKPLVDQKEEKVIGQSETLNENKEHEHEHEEEEERKSNFNEEEALKYTQPFSDEVNIDEELERREKERETEKQREEEERKKEEARQQEEKEREEKERIEREQNQRPRPPSFIIEDRSHSQIESPMLSSKNVSFIRDQHDKPVGEVRLIIKYEPELHSLKIRVAEVKIHEESHFSSHSSLYVKCYLLPDPTKKTKKKTSAKRRAKAMEFGEEFNYDVAPEDKSLKTISISVWASDLITREALAYGQINLYEFEGINFIDKWAPLTIEKKKIQVQSSQGLVTLESFTDASSIASKDDGPDAPTFENLGQISLRINYDSGKELLKINVSEGRNLKSCDDNGFSDPYVKIYLVPDPDKKTKKKTKVQKKTLTPTWNENFEYSVDKSSMSKKKLQVTVWDHDVVGKNDFMGELIIELNQIPFDQLVSKWYDLSHSSSGEIKLKIIYDQPSEKLSVTVLNANSLRLLHVTRLPDPYVKLYIIPDKSKSTKKKTSVRKKTANPDFNETFTYNLSDISDYASKTLEVTVVDDALGKNEVFGKVDIPISQIMKEKKIAQFFHIINDE